MLTSNLYCCSSSAKNNHNALCVVHKQDFNDNNSLFQPLDSCEMSTPFAHNDMCCFFDTSSSSFLLDASSPPIPATTTTTAVLSSPEHNSSFCQCPSQFLHSKTHTATCIPLKASSPAEDAVGPSSRDDTLALSSVHILSAHIPMYLPATYPGADEEGCTPLFVDPNGYYGWGTIVEAAGHMHHPVSPTDGSTRSQPRVNQECTVRASPIRNHHPGAKPESSSFSSSRDASESSFIRWKQESNPRWSNQMCRDTRIPMLFHDEAHDEDVSHDPPEHDQDHVFGPSLMPEQHVSFYPQQHNHDHHTLSSLSRCCVDTMTDAAAVGDGQHAVSHSTPLVMQRTHPTDWQLKSNNVCYCSEASALTEASRRYCYSSDFRNPVMTMSSSSSNNKNHDEYSRDLSHCPDNRLPSNGTTTTGPLFIPGLHPARQEQQEQQNSDCYFCTNSRSLNSHSLTIDSRCHHVSSSSSPSRVEATEEWSSASPSSSTTTTSPSSFRSKRRRHQHRQQPADEQQQRFTWEEGLVHADGQKGNREVQGSSLLLSSATTAFHYSPASPHSTVCDLPGVYFDKRKRGFRVRFSNVYVGWVSLSCYSTYEEAQAAAKRIYHAAAHEVADAQDKSAAVKAGIVLTIQSRLKPKNPGGRPRTVSKLPASLDARITEVVENAKRFIFI